MTRAQRPASKVTSLSDAVATHVKPGMTIHFGMAGSRPNAAIRELCRAYRDRPDARFTLCSTGFGGPQLGLFLVAAGLAERVVAGFAGDQYPSPRPNRALRRQLDNGLELEDWSLHTYLLRLRAAATNVPFMPTASLTGSDLARSRVRTVEVDGEVLTLVPALRPDIALIHGILADEDGNVLLSTPLGEGVLGAAASKQGAIVTVERIVSREELRAHAGVPAMPSVFVRAVCEVPFGAHPSGMYADHVDADLSYGDDYDFMAETVDVLATPDGVPPAWAARWLEATAETYLENLGAERLSRLRAWKTWTAPEARDAAVPATAPERLCAYAARTIRELAHTAGPECVLAGIGISSLATWLAAEGAEWFPQLISEVGFVGYEPAPGNPFLFYFPNIARTSVLTDADVVLGMILHGSGDRCMAVLAAGEIDETGATNASWTSRGWLTGSGGANDIASGAHDVVVVVPHSRSRLVEAVDFVTSPGRNVRAVVTDRAVMTRDGADEPFTLVAVRVDDTSSLEPTVQDIRESIPWSLTVGKVVALPEPTDAELRAMRAYDPERHFLGADAKHVRTPTSDGEPEASAHRRERRGSA